MPSPPRIGQWEARASELALLHRRTSPGSPKAFERNGRRLQHLHPSHAIPLCIARSLSLAAHVSARSARHPVLIRICFWPYIYRIAPLTITNPSFTSSAFSCHPSLTFDHCLNPHCSFNLHFSENSSQCLSSATQSTARTMSVCTR